MKFSEFDLNILGEIGNISVGGAATSLSDFMNKLVTISIPDTKVQTFKELKEEFGSSFVFAKIDYADGLEGSNVLLMKKEEAFSFSKIIAKEKLQIDVTVWDDFSKEVLAEVFNIMVGNMTSSMSEMFSHNIKIDTPQIMEGVAENMTYYKEDETLVTIWFEIRVENSFNVKLVKIINDTQAQQMIHLLREDHQL